MLLAEVTLKEGLKIREISCIPIRIFHILELSGVIIVDFELSLQVFGKDWHLFLRSLSKLRYLGKICQRSYLFQIHSLLIIGHKLFELFGSNYCVIVDGIEAGSP